MDVQINGTAGGLHLPVEACKQGDVQAVRASDGQKSAVSVLGQYLGFLPQGYVPLGDGYKLAAFGGELNVFKPFFPDNQREAQLLFEGLKPVAYGGLAEKQDIRCFCDAFCIHNGEEGFDFRKVHKQLLKYRFS